MMKRSRIAKILSLCWVIMIMSVVSAQDETVYQPVTLDDVQVVDIVETDLLSGPAKLKAYLAPNGEIFAYLRGDHSLCIINAETLAEQICFGLRDEMPIIACAFDTRRLDETGCYEFVESINLSPDGGNLAWSPDSRYIAIHNDYFRLLRQPDIYIFDVETGNVTIIDPDAPIQMSSSDWGMLDVTPRWLDDGRLTFLRYTNETSDEDLRPAPLVMVYDTEAQSLETIGTLSAGEGTPYAIYKFDIASDAQTLVHNFYLGSQREVNGVWIADIDGGNLKHIWNDELMIVQMVEFSPDGRHILVAFGVNDVTNLSPEQSPYQFLDLETETMHLIDPDRTVTGAGWSPDGSLLAYIVRDMITEDDNGLYITDEIGKAGRRILEGDFYVLDGYLPQALVWGANNRLLVAQAEGNKAIIVQLD